MFFYTLFFKTRTKINSRAGRTELEREGRYRKANGLAERSIRIKAKRAGRKNEGGKMI